MAKTNWIDQAFEEAKKEHPTLDESIISRIMEIVEIGFTERKFTPSEIKKISEKLISNINTNSDGEICHED
jgi:hypothetical protein